MWKAREAAGEASESRRYRNVTIGVLGEYHTEDGVQDTSVGSQNRERPQVQSRDAKKQQHRQTEWPVLARFEQHIMGEES